MWVRVFLFLYIGRQDYRILCEIVVVDVRRFFQICFRWFDALFGVYTMCVCIWMWFFSRLEYFSETQTRKHCNKTFELESTKKGEETNKWKKSALARTNTHSQFLINCDGKSIMLGLNANVYDCCKYYSIICCKIRCYFQHSNWRKLM